MALDSEPDTRAPGSQRDYLKLFVALLCVSAVGVAGTTYESTLDSDPDEIIDVKHEWLPIGKEPIQQFKDPQTSSDSLDSSGGGGSGEEPPPCSGGFVGVLATLVPSLIPPCGPLYLLGLVLPVVLAPLLVALTYRYRRRLIAPLFAVRGWLADRAATAEDPVTGTWPSEAPANEVHRAWVTMVEQTNLERPWARTPAECARAAADAGMDSEAVESLTTLFEEVEYGGAPLTDERRKRADYWRTRLSDGRAKGHTDGGERHP